ncbi:MAG: hypothetical protein ACRCX2_14725 [Paraclostridium sp.]
MVSTVVATVIFSGGIDHSLERYSLAVGVPEDMTWWIDLEEEMTMPDLNAVTSKKQYVFNMFIKDGVYQPKMFDVIKIKGLPVIKSDYNEDISSKVKKIFRERIMVKPDKLDYKTIIEDAKDLTESITKMIKSDDYILNKSTIKKSNKSSEELAFGDAKNKMARLWNRMDFPSKIEYPGSFKEIEVKITHELLDEMKENYPSYYIAFEEHTKEIKMFEFYRTVINNSKKLLSGLGKCTFEDIRKVDEGFYSVIYSTCKNVRELDPTKYNEVHAYRLFKTLVPENADESFIKIMRKAFDLSKDDVDMVITYDHIIDNINKVGIPLDCVEVPEFLKIRDYEMIDGEFAATGEFLLGKLTDSIGISCPRNKSNNLLISSALQTY